MTNKPVYVLGTGLSHDSSACLLKDGRICVAIEKERITRKKHDGGNDADVIKYCLEAEGITLDDVSLVVQNANFGMVKSGNEWWKGPRPFDERTRVVTISHHLAHAYSAIGTSPFDEAAVLIIDGCGNSYDECIDLGEGVDFETPPPGLAHLYYEKDSYYIFKENELKPVKKDFSAWGFYLREEPIYPNTTLHSIGGLYLGVSTYVFSGFEDPGKLMGLAPYGRPGVHDFEIFDLVDGRAFVRYDWMESFNKPCRGFDQFKANFQQYADLAYWVQKEVERAIVYVANSRYETAPCENLAYAGGVALNAVANRRVLNESKFKNIYIQPSAGDNGLGIGCAYYGWLKVLERERVKHNGSTCLGRSYSQARVQAAASKYRGSVQVSQPDNYIRETASLLADGKIIGWFQEGSEFGPRALGHRSILADPRSPHVRDFINARIKFREDFRPFAPSVIAEEASLYFDCDYESPYMILVAPVRSEWQDRIPAVIHKDKSARIQTVTRESDPNYYKLLQAFKAITGIGILLNTSFNRRGMPIVETPEQAMEFFMSCDLDAVVMEGCIVQGKKPRLAEAFTVSKLFRREIRMALDRNAPRIRAVKGMYQFDILGTQSWTIDLRDGDPKISEGPAAVSPDATVEITVSDLRMLLTGPEIDRTNLLRTDSLKIKGNPDLLRDVIKMLR